MPTRALAIRTDRATGKAYGALAPAARLRAILDAHARDDTGDADALIETTPRRAYTAPDNRFVRLWDAAMDLATETAFAIIAAYWATRVIDLHARMLDDIAACVALDALDCDDDDDRLRLVTHDSIREDAAPFADLATAHIAAVRAWWTVYADECERLGLDPDALLALAAPSAVRLLRWLRERPDWSTTPPCERATANALAFVDALDFALSQ